MSHLEAEKLPKTFIPFKLCKLLKLFYVSGQFKKPDFSDRWPRIQISLTCFQGESTVQKESTVWY